MRPFSLSAKLLVLCLSASAVAETHFCMGGDLDEMSAKERAECRTKMVEIRDAVKRHGAPAGWHFVVVCDEEGWKDYASFAGEARAQVINASYSTDAQLHWSFIRGSRMDADVPQEADKVLAAAMQNVPVRRAVPLPLANPQRTLAQPEQQIAERTLPESADAVGQ